jgi:hypothetical protein
MREENSQDGKGGGRKKGAKRRTTIKRDVITSGKETYVIVPDEQEAGKASEAERKRRMEA